MVGLSWLQVPSRFPHVVTTQELCILSIFLARLAHEQSKFYKKTRRPPVGWIFCAPKLSLIPSAGSSSSTVRPSTNRQTCFSLFPCRSQLVRRGSDPSREANPTVSSRSAHTYSRFPSMMCSFPQRYQLPSSCATLQPCYLEEKLVPLAVWCPSALGIKRVGVQQSTSFSRSSGHLPPVQRLCCADATARDQIRIVAQEVSRDLQIATE